MRSVGYTCTTSRRSRHGAARTTGALLISEVGLRSYTSDERAYFYSRLSITALLMVLYIGFSPQASEMQRWFYIAGLLLVVVAGIGFGVAVSVGGVEVSRAMMAVLVPDLVAIGLFTYSFHTFDDAFYVIVVLIAVVYALVLDRWTALGAGAAIAIAYMLGHLFGEQVSFVETTLFVLKGLAVPLLAWIVSNSVEKQREKEEEAEREALEKLALSERMGRRVSELQAVSEITEIVHSSLEFDRVGPVVLEILAKAIDINACCLFVVDKEKSETLFSASVGNIAGIPTGMAYGLTTDSTESHFACMPVFDHTNVMVLFCATSDDMDALTEEDRLVLGAVASELVVAVENSRLYKLTRRLAITDELTGLFNYRHLQQRLEEEVNRATRYGKQVSLLMLDADDFKGFNDTQGHIAGDAALAELGEVMRKAVREVDVVARYGGEEFSIVLPETDPAGAYVVAEKVRESISEHVFADAEGERVCRLTVSVGLANLPAHAEDKEGLLREADDALYHAKRGGKNRVRTPRRPVDTAALDYGDIDDASDEAGE